MSRLTSKEEHSITESFHEFLRGKSMLDRTFDKAELKQGAFQEFRQVRTQDGLKNTSFSSLLYFLKADGLATSIGEDRIELTHVPKLARRERVLDAVVVEKRKTRQKYIGTEEHEVHQWLAKFTGSNVASYGVVSNGQVGFDSGSRWGEINLSCLPPAIICETNGTTQFLKIVDGTSSKIDRSKMKLLVKNIGTSSKKLLRFEVMSKCSEFSLSETVTPEKKRRLKAGHEYAFVLTCNNAWENVGACVTEIMLQYASRGNVSTGIYFIRFEKKDDLVEKLKPKQKYRKPPSTAHVSCGQIVPGCRPPGLETDKLERKVKLQEYPVPNRVKEALSVGAFTRDASENGMGHKKMREILESPPSRKNYAEKFHLLLHLEELQNTVDIRRYDMSAVKMTKEGRMLFLQVPGLAEKRPSVLRGDRIYITIKSEEADKVRDEYEGYVHHVELDRVALGFSMKLVTKYRVGMRFNVRFTFNRLPMKLEHRAVSMSLSDKLRFPKKCITLYSDIKIKKNDFKNEKIRNNDEQMQAVNHIVRAKGSSVPYIVFGPPGTGKTVTMVEAIHQIVHIYEGCHVLVCAPSNSTCDHITKLLLEHLPNGSVFRMHAASRFWEDIPTEIRRVSNYRDGDYYYPSKRELGEYEVTVCTLITAGRLASAKFPDDHFTHVFIDEAGQAREPECMVPLGGVLALGGQVVLAGDPKQLGPVVMSSAAKKYGLGISYLERLMETEPLYQKNEKMCYDPYYITKLLNNYRSHEVIMKVPNECFYENELRFAAESTIVTSICKWDYLPQIEFPMIFEGVSGEDLRESTSPSFYNPQEISVISSYVQKVLKYGVASQNIGIIAPYRKQVEKIKKQLSNSSIKVGSVEEFQGQERDVIIISTVRSDSKYLSFDAKHNLGFLSDPKRFNVAVTRAKALLIVIGNPHILGLDYYWKMLLEYCIEMKAYRGIHYDVNERRTLDVSKIEKLLEEVADIELSDESD